MCKHCINHNLYKYYSTTKKKKHKNLYHRAIQFDFNLLSICSMLLSKSVFMCDFTKKQK